MRGKGDERTKPMAKMIESQITKAKDNERRDHTKILMHKLFLNTHNELTFATESKTTANRP